MENKAVFPVSLEQLQQLIGSDFDFLRQYDFVITEDKEHVLVTKRTLEVLMQLWELKLRREAITQLIKKAEEIEEKFIN